MAGSLTAIRAGSLAILTLSLLSGVATAGPFEDGIVAAQKGDFAAALRLWHPLAEAGDVGAQFNLGRIYAGGLGLPQDLAEASKWYQRAAEQGLARAQTVLGEMYLHGGGVASDAKMALAWFRKAADQGDAGGEYDLGVMYYQGLGTPHDASEARTWFHRAALHGSSEAQNNLGVMSLKGEGAPPDVKLAREWFQLSADQANGQAQLNLGNLYEEPNLGQNYVLAHMWLSLAAGGSGPDAVKNSAAERRDLLAQRMKPEDIKEATRLAGEWKARPRHCGVYALGPQQDHVPVDKVVFELANLGDKPVQINPPNSVVGPGESTLFAGDENFKYEVRLKESTDQTTIRLCM